jgi:hypothetical protein
MVTPKQLLALTVKWLLISAIVIFCALFIGDELSFLYKTHTSNPAGAFGSVDIQRVLAIELKGGKVEYTLDRQQPEQIVKCVHSVFPHAGVNPCWYLLRQNRQAIPLLIFFRSSLSAFVFRKPQPQAF